MQQRDETRLLSLSAMFPHGNGIEDEGDRDGRLEEREEGVI